MMKRSQIYLPVEQWRKLDALGHQTHKSVSHLIRQAIDWSYRDKTIDDFEKILAGVSGLWADRPDLPSSAAYLRGIRKGSRLKRLGASARA